jgi:hypothetical protein
MWLDPIVDEVRRIREGLAQTYEYDIARILQDAQRRQSASGHVVVRRQPRPAAPAPLTPPTIDAESESP